MAAGDGALAATAPLPLAGGDDGGGDGGSARMQAARVRRRRRGRVGVRGGGRRVEAVPVQAALLVLAVAALGVYRYVVPSTSASSGAVAVPVAGDGGVAAAVTARLTTAGRQEAAPASAETDSYGGLCTPADSFLKRPASLGLYIPGVLFLFLGLAIVTDDYFVSSLDRICEQLRLSDDVAGATFLAAGSSAPELFTSLISVFVTKDEVGVGTIVGSAVFNVLVIVGSAAALAGSVLQLDWRPLMRDSFFYFIFIALLFFSLMGTSRSEATWYEGLVLVISYTGYIAFMKWGNKPYMRAAKEWSDKRRARARATANARDVEAANANGDWAAGSTVAGEAAGPVGGVAAADGAAGRASLADDVDAWRKRLTEMDLLDASGVPTFPPGGAQTARTYLRKAGMVAIAMKRLEAASSLSSGDGAASLTGRMPSVSFSNPMGASDGGSAASDGEDDDEDGPTLLGVARPSSALGWVLFPGVWLWSTAFRLTILNCARDKWAKWWPVTFLVSVAWIGGISYAMVEAARHAGCIVNIPASVLGLTVLAAGTSVPDALASITVARQGRGDMAVSNALGSNVFDIGLGLGIPWFLGHLILGEPQVIPTQPVSSIVVPVVILCVVLFALLALLAVNRWRMGKLVGFLLIGGYGLFVAYALIAALVLKWV